MTDLSDPSEREQLRAELAEGGAFTHADLLDLAVSALDLIEKLIAREQAAERMAHWAVYVIQGGHVENGLGALDRAVRKWRALSSPEHEETR